MHPNQWAKRLRVARGFAALPADDRPDDRDPAARHVPHRRQRATPYLFSEQDICRLLAEARRLRHPMRAASYEALFGLLAVSGMRIGEAIALEREDVDLDAGLITIRKAKGDRERLVPLHPTATEALRRYASSETGCAHAAVARVLSLQRRHRRAARAACADVQGDQTRIGVRTEDGAPADPRSPPPFCCADPDRLAAIGRQDRRAHRHAVDVPRARQPGGYILVLVCLAGADGSSRPSGSRPVRRRAMSALAPAMQAYFTDRLGAARSEPEHDRRLLPDVPAVAAFAAKRTGNAAQRAGHRPTRRAADRRVPGASRESSRQQRPQTRNNRLAAIHSLFAYMALHHPEHAASIQRVLAIPHKRTERNLVTYLTEPEVDALLGACDQTTWTGRRDHAMFALTIQAGLRISELAALTCADITLTTGANVHTIGKGRKERRTPLVPATRKVLKAWLKERDGAPTDPLFPTTTGKHLSRDAIERRLARHLATAAESCPSLKTKHVTMHTLRHTAAMRLLLAGNDVTVIALWLGHEQISTTNVYLHADMTHKQQAIDRTKPLDAKPGRYQPPDTLLRFLEDL